MANKAIFLDRDDTLIEDPGYINDPDDVKLLPGAAETLAQLQQLGYKLVVVTNQSAVARGIVSEEVLEEIHERLETLLSRQGVSLDAIYYCPYHPDGVIGKYRRQSDLRKPNPGMLLAAARDMNIDLEQSWMIGNSYSDVAAGLGAGCKTILISSSANPPQRGRTDPKPDKIAVNIKEAINIIKMYQRTSRVVRPKKSRARHSAPAGAPRGNDNVASGSAEVAATDKNTTAAATEKDITEVRSSGGIMEKVKRVAAKGSKARGKSSEGGHGSLRHDIPDKHMQPQPDAAAGEKPAEDVPSNSSRTQEVLEEVVRHLKKADRMDMYEEFSLLKVAAGVAQAVVPFLLLLSVWFLLDHTYDVSAVHTTLLYAVVLQLMAIALYLMRDRR